MYFPYLRGKQFEFLALRELLENGLLSSKVIPIIEPVKLSLPLIKIMKTFVDEQRKLGVVCNPCVGKLNIDLESDKINVDIKNKFLDLLDEEEILETYHLDESCSPKIENLEDSSDIKKENVVVIVENSGSIEEYDKIFDEITPKFTLIPYKLRKKINKNKILFEEKFEKCSRNSDYKDNEDDLFSEDHLDYEDEGFIGFGDYSVIGEKYSEKGFAPFAVAIHIVYFDKRMNLRIHHFVSDSNEGREDTPQKFYEAVKKLSLWCSKNDVFETTALKIFKEHSKNQTYPGLGVVKKLSIMHHLELISKYLDGDI